MSERSGGGSGVGPFLLGAAIGAALGYLFAPAPGTETRRKLSRRLQDLKGLARGEAGEMRAPVAGGEGGTGEEDTAGEPRGSAPGKVERRPAPPPRPPRP